MAYIVAAFLVMTDIMMTSPLSLGTYAHVRTYICTCLCVCKCTHTRMRICKNALYSCLCVHCAVPAHMPLHMSAHMHVHMPLHMCVHMPVHIPGTHVHAMWAILVPVPISAHFLYTTLCLCTCLCIFMHATCTYVDGPKHDLSLETGGGFLPFWLELLTRVRTITI